MPALHNKAQRRTTWAGPSGQSEVVPWPDCSSHPNAETVESCTHTTSKLYHMGLTNCADTVTVHPTPKWVQAPPEQVRCVPMAQYTLAYWSAREMKCLSTQTLWPNSPSYLLHPQPAAAKHHKEQKPHASGLNTIPGLGIKSTGFQGKSKQSVLVS